MTFAHVNAGALGVVTSGGVTLAEPAAVQFGDLMVASIVFRGSVPFGAPVGWAQIGATVVGASSGHQWFWTRRGAAAPDCTFTRSGGNGALGRIAAWRPSAVVSLVASLSAVQPTSGTTHALPTGIASLADGQLVLAVGAWSDRRDSSAVRCTDPAGPSGTSIAWVSEPTTVGLFKNRVMESNGTVFLGMVLADAIKATTGATGPLTINTAAATLGALGIAVFGEQAPGSGGSITVDDFPLYKVFEGAAGSRTITVSGTHTGATDTIQVQIETDAGAPVVPWQTLQANVPAGAFSGAVTVPRGGWYLARVRKAADTAATDVQGTVWGVGLIIGAMGQSHLVGMDSVGTAIAAPSGRAVTFDGTAYSVLPLSGVGRATFVDALVAAANCPVCIVFHGSSGSALSYWWASGKTANYATWESRVAASDPGRLSSCIWWQGDSDASGTPGVAYTANLRAIISQLRADYGPALKVTIAALGRIGAAGDTEAQIEIRTAHMTVAGDAGNSAVVTLDAPQLADFQHFSAAGYEVLGPRLAQSVAQGWGFGAASTAIAGSIREFGPVQLDGSRMVIETLSDANGNQYRTETLALPVGN